MKNFKITSLVLLLGLVILSSCKDKTVDPPSAEDVQMELLAKTWAVNTGANAITLDGQDEDGNWVGFTIVFKADGTYDANNVSTGREVVWPTTGSWGFKDAGTDVVNINTIVRGDGVEMAIVVSENTLKMTFNYTDPGGRVYGTEGDWVFNMGN